MKKLVKLYGERNTNTNYLSELIRLNLDLEELPSVVPANIKRYQDKWPGNEWLRDLYFMSSYGRNLGWKHAAVNWPRLKRTGLYKRNSVTVVTLTKNPYAWLLSLYKRPYHQYYAKKPSFSEFLTRPWKTVWREGMPRWMESPVHLWNAKNASYLRDADEDRALHLRAEDTLIDPQQVIERIAQVAGMVRPSEFRNVLASTKDGSKDFNYYRDYYLGESWRSGLAEQDIEIINRQLDKRLVRRYGYALID
ncbi:hypothetical protein L1F06_008915 [Ectopseudomonas hydrolytica]|uniref:Sulfotransferase n=1 Tax=Ectopseudomonas hydrolytica TaxID=2493633 RepID=A0ABY5ACC8_9GAMM|nr:hypothetical protein [Pseudomonas hydrolytica]USR41528.1 hypothetical protein L1F06_008915 [Pseudomonas hydrolytica]